MNNTVKDLIKKNRIILKPLKAVCEGLCVYSRWSTYVLHKSLLFLSIPFINEDESYFNHFIDLYTWRGRKSKFPNEPYWIERGVYNLLAIKNFTTPIVVELCCGDGFNTRMFYSKECKDIYAVDIDKKAIAYAKRKNQSPNTHYIIDDVRSFCIEKVSIYKPTNIIWDASLIYFDRTELLTILREIKNSLAITRGILSGMVPLELQQGKMIKSSFENKDEVRLLLSSVYDNVCVFETDYSNRKNVYFYASDFDLPIEVRQK